MIGASISSKLRAPIWAAFRRRSHKLLEIGYKEAMRRILCDADEETDITGYICEAIDEWLLRNPREGVCFFLKDDPPLGGTGKTGKRRPRTDIIIGYAAGVRPQFLFESKRLHRTKAAGSRYTGAGGMGCFISGRYASGYAEAAMIGYVQTDTMEHWCAELHRRIHSKAIELDLERIESVVEFPSAFPLEWASTHRRQGYGPIRLFHIILDCRKTGRE